MRYKKEVFKIHSYKAVFSFGILLKMKKLTWFASHSVREFCGPIFHAFVFFSSSSSSFARVHNV